MRVVWMSKSLNREVETDVSLMSELFELQRAGPAEHVVRDIYAARNGKNMFVLTDFRGDMALVDVLPVGDVQTEMLKGNSIGKLMEIKRGNLVLVEDSLVGSALPTRP
jgi:hypothetical protein